MVRISCRRGHSLPELIVAVTLLGATLGAVGATAAAAASRTRDAALRQEAVRRAATLLDSLLAAPRPADGERQSAGIGFRWTISESGAARRVEVRATGPGGHEMVRLKARWFPREAPLPGEDAMTE